MGQQFITDGDEVVAFQGRIIEVIHQPMKKGDTRIVFERAQRSPGVRVIIIDETGRILLTKEHRYELDDYDYRLPGGKVADSLEEWHALEANGQINQAAKEKAIAEAREEAGILVQDIELLEVVPDGATVSWDLYFFLTKNFSVGEQALEYGEDVSVAWYESDEVLNLMAQKQLHEGRSVYMLLPYVLGSKTP